MVFITNKAVFFARFTQNGSAMVVVMMSSINPSIDAFVASIFTASWYALTSGSETGRYSSLGSKFL